MIEAPAAPRRPIRAEIYAIFLILFAAIALLTHALLLNLPYFWDELGQFVPAALDLFQTGAWIPHSTVPNVHPPGLMAYLALFWRAAGYSVRNTRIAMLLLAAVALLVAFLLAIELCRNVRGTPAFLAVFLLCCSPLFFAQAMLAQLDMPAMLLGGLVILLFLQEKIRLAAAVSIALVLVKETGLLVPLVCGGVLLYNKRFRDAAWFVLPAAALGGWLAVLARTTGHLFGNSEFTRYNLYYPFHPVRFAFALFRRLYYLFFQDFHWIGTIAIVLAWRKGGVFTTRGWRVAWAMIAVHVLFLSAVGGAMLERYLLPVLPLVYAAMAAAMSIYRRPVRLACQGALFAGLIAGNFWNPPYPFPFENNLEFASFVRVQQAAADLLARRYPGQRIATAWPLTAELSRPEFGYVPRALPTRALPDFTPAGLAQLNPQDTHVFVLFSRMWEPAWSFTRFELVRKVWRRFYGFERELTPADMLRLPVTPVAHFEERGMWADVYELSPGTVDAEK